MLVYIKELTGTSTELNVEPSVTMQELQKCYYDQVKLITGQDKSRKYPAWKHPVWNFASAPSRFRIGLDTTLKELGVKDGDSIHITGQFNPNSGNAAYRFDREEQDLETVQTLLNDNNQLRKDAKFLLFKTQYLTSYSSSIFKNPFSKMRKMLSSEAITSIEEVQQYAADNSSSRAAKVLGSMK